MIQQAGHNKTDSKHRPNRSKKHPLYSKAKSLPILL
jgi:hypothetical protein